MTETQKSVGWKTNMGEELQAPHLLLPRPIGWGEGRGEGNTPSSLAEAAIISPSPQPALAPPSEGTETGYSLADASPRLPARFLPLALLLVALGTGCQSFHVQDYVSPRITGRVLDADTKAPVPEVTVRRRFSDSDSSVGDAPKGGERMLSRDEVRTDKEGRFEMTAEKDVLTFSSGMYLVRLQFQHSRYETLRTNYSGKSITEAGPKRPPELNAGEILLRPSGR